MSVQSESLNASATRDNYRYDIFISYSSQDKPWVDDYLTPVLSAAGLRCAIDRKDFKTGIGLKKSIREAVEQSRRILLVMTPSWERSRWTKSELKLAMNGKKHILPIKLKACELPSEIANDKPLYLDLSDIWGRDEAIKKLLGEIGVAEDGIARALNSVAKKTLLWLTELMEDPKVRENVKKLDGMFRQVQKSNDVLRANKQLHDDLQDIQTSLTPLTIDTAAEDWQKISRGVMPLYQKIGKMLNHATTVEDLVDVSLVDPFRRLSENLDGAIQARDAPRLSSCIDRITRQVEVSLPRINERIVSHVKDRWLEELAESLKVFFHKLSGVTFDEKAEGLVKQLEMGICALEQLAESVGQHVADHNTLQNADPILQRMLRDGDNTTLNDISGHWNEVEDWILKLKLADRYDKLLTCFRGLSQQLSDDQCVRDDQFEEHIQFTFNRFVQLTTWAFNKLDEDLLQMCKSLNSPTDELQGILTRMQSYDTQS